MEYKTVIETPAEEITINQFLLTFFGMSEEQFISEVVKNPGGKWDFLYKEGGEESV